MPDAGSPASGIVFMLLTDTYDVTRLLLGDLDATVRQFADSTLAVSARSVIQLGKIVGVNLTVDRLGVEPDPTTAQFALWCYWQAKLLLNPSPDNYSFRTRAFAEKFGHQRDLLGELGARIHELENGTGVFSGWQSYYTWLIGMEGLPVGGILTDVNIRAPFFTATVTRAGAQISGGGTSVAVGGGG